MSEVADKLNLSDYCGEIGRNDLYKILQHHKIVDKHNRPMPKYVRKGYFISKPTGTLVKEAGLNWLNQKFSVEKTNDNGELKSLLGQLRKDHEVLWEGVGVIAETMLYNKGGNHTEEKNRLNVSRLNCFLDKVKQMPKALN
jgi:hypothetical protein